MRDVQCGNIATLDLLGDTKTCIAEGVKLDGHHLPFYVTRQYVVLLENSSSLDSNGFDQDLETFLREDSEGFSVYKLEDL